MRGSARPVVHPGAVFTEVPALYNANPYFTPPVAGNQSNGGKGSAMMRVNTGAPPGMPAFDMSHQQHQHGGVFMGSVVPAGFEVFAVYPGQPAGFFMQPAAMAIDPTALYK